MKIRLIVISLVVLLGGYLTVSHAQAPAPTTTTTISTTVTVAPPIQTTTTTTIPPHQHPECAEWLALAATLGWPASDYEMLERVMWKESRCDPTQFNPTDPNGGSIGLTQVNRFWCLPSRYYPHGYLQTVGTLTTCDELWNPAVNLAAALIIREYADGWSPWGL